jgi:hypothetical protein
MSVAASSAASAASVIAHLAPTASPAQPWWAQGFWTSELAKGLPAAFVALVIGLSAAGIAWRQAQIAGAKLKLELFEQRYAIFLAVWRAVSAPGIEAVNLDEEVTGIANMPSRAAFLFGWPVGRYVREVRDNLARYRDLGPGGNAMRGADDDAKLRQSERSTLRAWFALEAAGNCHERFKPFLDFSQWK